MFGVSLCVGQGGSPCPRPASWLPLIPASILVPGLYQMMDFEKAESEEMAAPPVQLRGGREGGRTKEPHRQACVSIAPQKKEGGETAVASSGGGRWEGWLTTTCGPDQPLDVGAPSLIKVARERRQRDPPGGRQRGRQRGREAGREATRIGEVGHEAAAVGPPRLLG